ncbi:MAG: protein-L-isoaspartate(D-aspartate) O-methyltransferase [Opitutales bacterium]
MVRQCFSIPSTLLVFFGAAFSVLLADVSAKESYQKERERLVREEIRARGIRDSEVLDAMRSVPRHLFVPGNLRERAYLDRPLPIGHGQTISQPYIVAYMTEQLDLEAGDRVLEIGSGSGYQAAVLAEITDEVYSIEIVAALEKTARQALEAAGYGFVELKHADGYFGWPEQAPFEAIIITAATPTIPPPLIDQLADGGRMMLPLGSPYGGQRLVLVTRNGEEISTRSLLPVRFVPFTRKE